MPIFISFYDLHRSINKDFIFVVEAIQQKFKQFLQKEQKIFKKLIKFIFFYIWILEPIASEIIIVFIDQINKFLINNITFIK